MSKKEFPVIESTENIVYKNLYKIRVWRNEEFLNSDNNNRDIIEQLLMEAPLGIADIARTVACLPRVSAVEVQGPEITVRRNGMEFPTVSGIVVYTNWP